MRQNEPKRIGKGQLEALELAFFDKKGRLKKRGLAQKNGFFTFDPRPISMAPFFTNHHFLAMCFFRKTLFAAFVFCLGSVAVFGQDMSKKQLQKMYTEYLKDEGYKGEIDDDGDVTFKVEGKAYYINVQEDDAEFFRILSLETWAIESEAERVQCYKAATEATTGIKAGKAIITDEKVRFSIEQFVAKPQDFKGIFVRSISALDSVKEAFIDNMKKK